MSTFYRLARFYLIALSLLSISLFASVSSVHAQGVTSLGTDFWLGFMPNSFSSTCCPPQAMEIFIGSGTANTVSVDVYGGNQQPVHQQKQMTANTIWTLYSPEPSPWINYNTEDPAYYAIHVYSSNPVVVYGYQFTGANTSSTDSYLAIPTPALGTEYYPSCYYDDQYTLGPSNPLAGQFLIISPFDNNVVTIGPVKTPTRAEAQPQSPGAVTISHNRGDTWNVTLMKGQTYLVQSTGLNYGNDDITGTHIVSSEPIALISGHQLCSIPIGELASSNGSKDEVMEMIPPLQAWGHTYFDMPTATRNVCGDLVRVIAGEPNERITATSVNGAPSCILANPGDFYDFDLVTDPTVFSSQGGKKFLAVQMAYSQGYNGDPGESDPFSIVLTPEQQFQKKMIFNIPDRTGVPGFVHYGTFLCQTDSIMKIQINGKPISFYIPAGSAPIPGTNPPISAYRVQWPGDATVYVATCGAPFGLYLYGWSTYESYGHPAGMALGIPSPDTLPPLAKADSTCGSIDVELMELRHPPDFSFNDTKISDIQMITDTLDSRWPKPSYNFAFSYNQPFTPGDSLAFFKLSVINPAENAYAAVWATDRAGNDSVYQYYYYTPTIKFTPPLPLEIQPVRVATDSCETVTLVNQQKNDLKVTSASIDGIDTAGKFTLTAPTLPLTLHPNDTLMLNLCFNPSDTISSWDTLRVTVGDCASFRYPLNGLGITPLIIASDLNFGNVTVGTSSPPQPVTVRNVGKASLTLDKNWKLDNSTDFSFADASQLPITIPPGGIQTLNFVFTPQATGPFVTLQHWSTDLPLAFAHQIKDTSQLVGFGVQAGLNWDRPKQGFWTECTNPVIDTVHLRNPSGDSSGTNITVDSIVLAGVNANEFSIIATEVGYVPNGKQVWVLTPNSSKWVVLQFTPNTANGYVPRSAQLIAYGISGDKSFTPTIDLSGTVRHSTIRITPPNYDFGTPLPGSLVSTNEWIHNDGDTVLSLTNLTINNGFTLSGFTPGEQVLPGDSVMVTVHDTAQVGSTVATMIAHGIVPCTDTAQATFTISSSSFIVQGIGHDFGNFYVCQNGSAVLTATDLGSKNAVLIDARIIDSLGTSGASQFKFSNGSNYLGINRTLTTDSSYPVAVTYTPKIGGDRSAWIVYDFEDPVTLNDTSVYQPLSGNPLHYVNTLSVKNTGTSGVYTAYPGQGIVVPVQMNTSLNDLGGIYSIQFTLRYKSDMFIASPVTPAGGLQLINSTTSADPTDPSYVLNTVTVGSTSPIAQIPVIANLPLEYVLNKDSISDIQVLNPVYMDSTGAPACWVTPDTIPSAFAGLDRCGDLTIGNLLRGGLPTFRIQQITPNPVTTNATVTYSVRLDGVPLTMEVYNVLGQREAVPMENTPVSAGNHSATVEIGALSSGQHILRMSDGTTTQSLPFVVQK